MNNFKMTMCMGGCMWETTGSALSEGTGFC